MILHTFVILIRSLDMPYDQHENIIPRVEFNCLKDKNIIKVPWLILFFVECPIVFCVTCDLICDLWPVTSDLTCDL